AAGRRALFVRVGCSGTGSRGPPIAGYTDVMMECLPGPADHIMSNSPGLKAALKRGALLAAANWPLVIVQFVAESSLKLLLAVPIVGGAFLVALLLDTSLTDLLSGDARDIVTAILSALTANPAALIAFV